MMGARMPARPQGPPSHAASHLCARRIVLCRIICRPTPPCPCPHHALLPCCPVGPCRASSTGSSPRSQTPSPGTCCRAPSSRSCSGRRARPQGRQGPLPCLLPGIVVPERGQAGEGQAGANHTAQSPATPLPSRPQSLRKDLLPAALPHTCQTHQCMRPAPRRAAPPCRRTCWWPRSSATSCWRSASCAAPTARPAPTRACRPRTSTPCGRPGTWRQRCASCRWGRGWAGRGGAGRAAGAASWGLGAGAGALGLVLGPSG